MNSTPTIACMERPSAGFDDRGASPASPRSKTPGRGDHRVRPPSALSPIAVSPTEGGALSPVREVHTPTSDAGAATSGRSTPRGRESPSRRRRRARAEASRLAATEGGGDVEVDVDVDDESPRPDPDPDPDPSSSSPAEAELRAKLEKVSSQLRRALLALVPIRPRWRGESRFLRTVSPGVRLSPPRVPRFQRPTSTSFNSASDAFQLRPDVCRFAWTLDPQRDEVPRAQTDRVRGDGDDARESCPACSSARARGDPDPVEDGVHDGEGARRDA